MSVTVTMPQLGESVTEGTVTRWLKQVGEEVRADEPLVEVSTDKVDTEIPAPASGVLLSIAAGEDETVPVGAALGVIGAAGEAPAAEAPAAPAAPEAAAPRPPRRLPPRVGPGAGPGRRRAPAGRRWRPPLRPPLPSSGTVPPDPNPPRSGSHAVSGTETPVILPALGESVTEGTVTRWLKKVGDMVSADEPLLEVSTDKVDTELPAPSSGTLLEIRVLEDETAEVGQTLGIIGTPAPAGAPAPPPAPAPAAAAPEPVAAPVPAASPAPPAVRSRAAAPAGAEAPSAGAHASAAPSDLYVTPLVRKLAAQSGVDLSTVRGTGVGGRITKQDIFDAKNRPAGAAPAAAAAAPSTAPAAPAPATSAPAAPCCPARRLPPPPPPRHRPLLHPPPSPPGRAPRR